jgi:hypothetical protein
MSRKATGAKWLKRELRRCGVGFIVDPSLFSAELWLRASAAYSVLRENRRRFRVPERRAER